MQFNTVEFRKALSQFTTGVTVVSTFQGDGMPRGFTANSFTSVSLDPPLVLVCIGDFTKSKDLFRRSETFSICVLNERQMEISNLFASSSEDKFKKINWSLGEFNTPLVQNSLAWFECKNFQQVNAGDHLILIGKVSNFGTNSGYPLGYFQGNYITLNNEKSLINAISKNTQTIIGVIFDNSNAILFYEDPKSKTLTLPCIGEKGERANTTNLIDKFKKFGFKEKLDFVYSVYEDKLLERVCIYYRSKDIAEAPVGHKYYNFKEIPWDRIKDEALIIMLKRYIEEAIHGNFAIYMGDEASGFTQTLK